MLDCYTGPVLGCRCYQFVSLRGPGPLEGGSGGGWGCWELVAGSCGPGKGWSGGIAAGDAVLLYRYGAGMQAATSRVCCSMGRERGPRGAIRLRPGR